MNRYIVVWERGHQEFSDIIDNVENEQEAVDEVRRIHVCAIVRCVGILSKNETWK